MEAKDILDYDQMKIEEGGENGGVPKPALSHLNQTISDAFKPKKLKEAGAPLRKYIETFVAYEFKQKPDHMVIEDDEPAAAGQNIGGGLQTNKIDKAAYCRDLQKCMNKWNKNKGVAELNDVFAKLAKDPSEAEAAANKSQKDASYSVPSTKEDSKKRKKGGSSSHATNAVANNIKDAVKEPPALRKQADSMVIEQSAAPASGGSGGAAATSAAVKDPKKGKDKENIDELAIMYYENPLKDAEFETMFKASVRRMK